MDQLHIEVKALDAGNGYTIDVRAKVGDDRTELHEHRDTEAAVQTRLATIWQAWAAQVDAE